MAVVTTPVPLAEAFAKRRTSDLKGNVFFGLLVLALLVAFAALAAVVITVVRDAWPVLSGDVLEGSFWTFLNNQFSTTTALSGVSTGIVGSVFIALIVALTAFPIGIGAAIYLEEYASDTPLTRFIQIAVRNLAGVPSIVYGLLGLAIFVQYLGGITGGRSVISGGLTLACLVLPVVIITSAEALRAVPGSIREGGYGLGATKWEVVRFNVLPSAMPGILTGTVLSIARAIGEAAPILVVGAVTGFFQTGTQSSLEQMQGFFTALPMNIFAYTKLPSGQWGAHAAGASVVILLVVFAINSVAIYFRARISRKLKG